ncbi:membrane protein of unknown function [Magnetospirillum gryphiswaldense MSR-1 v2]|uniref:Polysaccharide biosynthesis protein n=1 Tax=Magnetospirillum gryphiswaldense (strain DSM 6361 / JCM 21280 / NBRC 15271 / MSR-1) TaxID=431944 RepID=V6EXI2_MAGGM|nr:hypothetical protein [Magnetospirillum gryphiswaldense]CDK97817.1 membrane protein of unknown function [Magnetospirillum gryphiswaldense MSR-1 v2]
MTTIWQRALHPLGPVGAQGLSQAANLAAQLALIAFMGKTRFADLGLGLMTAATICFISEIGLGTYFLRESARSEQWLDSWRQSVGSRLIVAATAAALAWAALAWGAPNPGTARLVLLAAIPGVLISAANPTPLLFGLDKVRTASGGILLRFAIQSAGGVAIALAWPHHAEIGVGLAFSAGIVAQVLVGQMAGLPILALAPRRPRTVPPKAALRLWGLSLVGTINDRALPFVIGNAHPEILSAALIGLQILQTLVGIGTQMDRLLIPAVARGERSQDAQATWRRLHMPLLLLILPVIAATPVASTFFMPGWELAAFIFALEWASVVIGTLAFALAFARGGEKRVAYFMLVAVPLSTVAQVFLGGRVPLELILALRLIVAAFVGWLASCCVAALVNDTARA